MRIIRFKTKDEKKVRRHARVRAKVVGGSEKPRLSVFRSNKHLFVQLIDDTVGKTIVSASDAEVKDAKKNEGFAKVEKAKAIGKLIAEKALAKNINSAVFDRGGNRFAGRIKAVADGAREGGLQM